MLKWGKKLKEQFTATFEENILQRNNQKRDKKIQDKHISHCSVKWNSEKGRERVNAGGKKMYIYI